MSGLVSGKYTISPSKCTIGILICGFPPTLVSTFSGDVIPSKN
jgi:uncharacterized membrane protein YdjX (TVP38/TMEM64 family)